MHDSNDCVSVPSPTNRKVLVFAGLVLLGSVLSLRVNASPDTYPGSGEYNRTAGYRGWTYWDSLGQQMVWDAANSRWTCLNALTPWCYWTSTGGHPGIDRNVFRRWTPPGAGSARITGSIQKDSTFCDEHNVAVGKTSTQSTVGWGGVPGRGNDGNTNGDYWAGSVMHTDYNPQAWYQIDLGASYLIHRIEVWNRSDGSSGESARATNFNVMTSADGSTWTTVNVPGQAGFPTSLAWASYGRYAKVQLVGANYLHLAEVKVFSNANDGVFARVWHDTAQSNHYVTYTIPGPAQRTAPYSWYMACSDSNAYTFDVDAEIYPGDKIEFEINRNSNYNWDETTFNPTIVFEPADAIGDPWTTTTPTSVEVHFNGFLRCPNGDNCGFKDTLPPDYYTVHRMGTITSGSVFLGQVPNWARCGPADGRFCVDIVRPSNFSVLDKSGISPSSSYKYKIRAYRGTYPNGRLYGQTRTIQTTTGAITPPALTPTVSVTAASFEYGSRDAVISWQAPAPPLDKPSALERFELYRQGLSSVTISPGGAVTGYGTGEQFCAALPQSAFPGQWTCLSSTAPGGSCSVSFNYGGATCALWDPPVRVGYTTWDNNNAYQIWRNTADQGSPSRDTDGDFGLISSVTDPGVDRKPTTYRYHLVARYKSAYASPTETSEVTAKIVLPRADTLAGFADAHVHQFGNLAHGGTFLDGRSGDTDDGSPTYDPSLRNMGSFFCNNTGKALRGCDAVADGGTGAHDFGFWGNTLTDLLGAGHSKTGIKELPQWLLYSNSLHQQVYKTALKRAVDGGLRLMVMQAVNSEFLCKVIAAVRGNGQSPISCDDSTALDLQITAAYRFQSEIDREANCTVPDVGLPNTNLDHSCGWYRIVTTPAAARKAMKNGKLAVVLGIEAATPFACGTGSSGGMWAGGDAGNWNQGGTRPTCAVGGSTGGVVNILNPLDGNSLQYFYNRGVRHVFPVHGANNGLGSTAFFNPSNLYAYNQAALNGTWFRAGACLNRGASLDGPMAFRIRPAMKLSLGPFGEVDFGAILGPSLAVPAGFPGGTGATCNSGGNFGDITPAFGLTSLGSSVLQEMMKRRMIIDVDHMSERTHVDAVAESQKSFNYPLVSGHANLQKISTRSGGDPGSEVSLSTPELNEVRASGGQVNLVAVASFKTDDIAPYLSRIGTAAAKQFLPRAAAVDHNCDNSSKAWAQAYLAAVDLTRSAPMPDDNSAPGVHGVGFGSDFNTMMSMLQPRFGYKNGDWYGCSGFKSTSGNEQQEEQMRENEVGGVGKAVQYDVDMIDGSTTLRGHGGIATDLPEAPDLNFPGFSGPRLRRSRLNEGGYLFTLYGPDKPATSTGQYSETTKCLDSWGRTNPGDWPRIDHCGDTTKFDQQWLYSNRRIVPLRDQTKNLVLQLNTNNTYVLMNSGCTSNCEWAVTYASASSSLEGMWVTLASGQLYNPRSNRCLGVQNHGYGAGNFVVAAPCAGHSFGSPLQPDQMWARGSEEESFNLTGLHHIGMYPDLIQDLKNIGVFDKDLVPLFQSAEGYLQMWERTGWTTAIDYTKLSSDGTWKFTTASPAAGWQNINFNDTTWRSVSDTYSSLAAYGDAPWYANVSGLPNPTPARWMPISTGNQTYYFRKTFASDRIGTPKTVTVSGDDVVNVYLDGVLKASSVSWQVPATFTFTPSSFGSHVIAIEATNKGGPGGVLVDVR